MGQSESHSGEPKSVSEMRNLQDLHFTEYKKQLTSNPRKAVADLERWQSAVPGIFSLELQRQARLKRHMLLSSVALFCVSLKFC